MEGRRGHRLKGVYAARTTEANQPRFDYFLQRLAKHLGAAAMIKHAGSTHVTLLESCGVKDQFYSAEFTARDVRQFSKRMQQRIDRSGHYRSPMKGRVDPEQPLSWFGWPPQAIIDLQAPPDDWTPSKLALGLVLDERLRDQRGIIEEGLREEFGELPQLREFHPHITIGAIKKPWRQQHCNQDPLNLLPKGLAVPKTVALNGLAVYLDRIHSPAGPVVVD